MDKNIPDPNSAGKIKIGFQVCVHANAQNMSKTYKGSWKQLYPKEGLGW